MLVVPKFYLSQYDEIKAKNDYRQISILLWLDSAPSDWYDRIQGLGYECLISPLHDKDVLEDGTAKKAHYHVFFLFPGKKTADQCQFIADTVSGQVDYPFLFVPDRKVHARYLCHLDSPHKHRYPLVEVVQVNGASILKWASDDDKDQQDDEILNDILSWIRERRCRFFNQLLDYALDNHLHLWVSRLKKDLTPIVKAYMQGLTLEVDNEIKSLARYKLLKKNTNNDN